MNTNGWPSMRGVLVELIQAAVIAACLTATFMVPDAQGWEFAVQGFLLGTFITGALNRAQETLRKREDWLLRKYGERS